MCLRSQTFFQCLSSVLENQDSYSRKNILDLCPGVVKVGCIRCDTGYQETQQQHFSRCLPRQYPDIALWFEEGSNALLILDRGGASAVGNHQTSVAHILFLQCHILLLLAGACWELPVYTEWCLLLQSLSLLGFIFHTLSLCILCMFMQSYQSVTIKAVIHNRS